MGHWSKNLAKTIWITAAAGAALAAYGLFAQAPRGIGPSPDLTRMRVMTYNIEWFNAFQPKARNENLRSVIRSVNPDIVGVQEVENTFALSKIFDKNWSIGLLNSKEEKQNLGIAVRKPYVLREYKMMFPSPADDFAFPGKRDVLHAVIETPSRDQLDVFVVHFKSRRGGRLTTDPQRHAAAEKLGEAIRNLNLPNVIVLGDFNDSPLDTTLTKLAASATYNAAPMVNLTQPLYEADGVSIGLHDLYKGKPIAPVVAGAFADNERLKGKDYKFPDDVKVTQTLFDNIVVSAPLRHSVKDPGAVIYSGEDALRGKPGTGADRALASDHLPVYADFVLPLKKTAH